MPVTGIVLAAGASRRLGRPKQVLPYRGATLLDSTLGVARECGFDRLLVTVGGAAASVRAQVDLTGVEVVDTPQFADGCGSSIRAALAHVDPETGGVVLLLGDQPGISPSDVQALIGAGSDAGIGVVRYLNGLGHPFWFGRALLGELAALHGDKAVWKLLHSGRFPVSELGVDAPRPRDVDTWADYEALLAAPLAAPAR